MSSDAERYYKRFLEQLRRGSYTVTNPKDNTNPEYYIKQPEPSNYASKAKLQYPSPRRKFKRTRPSSGMNVNARVHEIDGVDSSKVKNFPFSSFKLLGALQIGIGVTCLLLGIVDLFLFLYTSTHYEDDTLKALTIACIPVWCALWFVVAGAMGSCMSLQHKTTLTYFKMSFMVLSVLNCILFGPVLFGIEVYIVVLRSDGAQSAHEWLLPLVIAFFALNEIICSIITASICCCCSPLNQAKVRVLYTRQVDELDPPEKRRLDTPEIFYTDSSRLEKPYSHTPVQRGRRNEPAERNHVDQSQPNSDDETFYDHWDEKQKRPIYDKPPVNEKPPVNDKPPVTEKPPAGSERRMTEPRVAISSDSPVMTHYSRPPTYEGNQSYRRMKQFSLPGNPDSY